MTLVAAHRGLSAEHPENTVAAFEAAAVAGFDAIEMDVRVTADGEVVVLHDAGIDRTTDGNGRIADMRYDEVRGYDTGAGPVPRLTDVCRALRDWQGIWDIEVKAKAATRPAIEVLRHHNLLPRAVLTAMDPTALAKAEKTASGLLRGLITLGPPDGEDVEEARSHGCSWLMADHEFVDATLRGLATEHGLNLGAWTVNDADTALRLKAVGVDMVITDTREVLAALRGGR